MRRVTSFVAALTAAAALLAACDGGTVAGPDADPRFTDYQCVQEPCWQPPTLPTTKDTSTQAVYEFETYVDTTSYFSGGVLHRTASYGAWSRAIKNVATTTLDVSVYAYSSLSTCSSSPPLYERVVKSAQGSPAYLEYEKLSDVTNGFRHTLKVRAIHTFVAAPGKTGGGEFIREKLVCF